jgi:hypothetical protein
MERRRAYSFRCRVTMLAKTATSTSQVRTKLRYQNLLTTHLIPPNSIPFSCQGHSQSARRQYAISVALGLKRCVYLVGLVIFIQYPSILLNSTPFSWSPPLEMGMRWAAVQHDARKLSRIISSPERTTPGAPRPGFLKAFLNPVTCRGSLVRRLEPRDLYDMYDSQQTPCRAPNTQPYKPNGF